MNRDYAYAREMGGEMGSRLRWRFGRLARILNFTRLLALGK